MTRPGGQRTVTVLGALLALACCTGAARADEIDSRFGIVPLVGGGIAGLPHSGPLPSFVGITTLGGEILGEAPPWGGFARGEFLSSGDSGRWTALSFALGMTRRLFGVPERLSLLVRGGLAYQHWHGSAGGCQVLLFVPNSCVDASNPPTPGNIVAVTSVPTFNANALGILAGVRLEVPITPVYLAFDVNFVPTIDVDSTPRAAVGLIFDLVLGFRDHRKLDNLSDPQQTGPRFRRGY